MSGYQLGHSLGIRCFSAMIQRRLTWLMRAMFSCERMVAMSGESVAGVSTLLMMPVLTITDTQNECDRYVCQGVMTPYGRARC